MCSRFTPCSTPPPCSGDRKLNYFAHFNLYVALAALMAGYGVRLSDMRRLNLTRARADRFGGTIHISERYSGGTVFQIELPLYQTSTQKRGEGDEHRGLRIA